jgi:CheY-like chemotaxis protein
MQNRKVAVIDDDKKFFSEIEEVLLMGGYIPVVVDNAHAAVDTIVASRPDVVLLELRMPGKNGFELTHAIDRIFETRRIPLIVLSDFFKKEFGWLLDLCDIKRWLIKPFHPLDVIWAIENEIDA